LKKKVLIKIPFIKVKIIWKTCTKSKRTRERKYAGTY